MNVTADALSVALLHSLWQDAVVGVLLWSALVVLRRRSANSRYVVCCAALTLMAALPIVTTMVLSEQGSPGPPPTSRNIVAAPATGDDVQRAPFDSRAADAGSPGWMTALTPWMLPVWMTGVLVCSLRLVLAGTHTVALKRHSVAESGPLAATVSMLAKRLGVRRPVSVRVSTMMTSPATFGAWRPVILLPPATALGITPQQLEALLAHELAHVRRYDYLVNVLQMVAETLFFYHPVVWWTSRRIRIERELCCDDIAVQACGDAVGYARALTQVARLLVTQPGIAVGAAGGPLVARIHRLLGVATASRTVSPLWIAAVTLVMVVALMFTGPHAQSSRPGTLAPSGDEQQTSLRGRVVDAGTGKPVGGASVRAQYVTGTDNPPKCPIGDCEPTGRAAVLFPAYRVTTDADGRFDIRGLRPGDYLVAAVAPGYVQRYFGQTSDDMPETTVGVAAGESTSSIEVRLVAAGSVSGRIFSSAGEGLPGVEVELLRRAYLPGGRQPVAVAFAQTEEGGTYRFGNVTPGEYYVRGYAPPSLEPERKEASLSYVASFFSEATDVNFAQPIVLASGQELSGVDFALTTAKTRTVSGWLVDPAGASLSGVAVRLMPYSTGLDEALKASARADGRFSFPDVPAADYMLTVMDRTDGRSWNTAARKVSVLDDVSDLLLVAAPSVSVGGRFMRDDGRPLPFDASTLQIRTHGTSSADILSAGFAKVATDGTFSMRSGAGPMNLRIDGLPPRWFVQSAQLDGVDVTDASFDLMPGRERRLDIALTDRASRLSGTVTDRSARPVPNALVVIFPEDRARWMNPCNLAPRSASCRSIFTTFSRQQGAYEIDALPMSRYRVVAVTSLPRNAWTDPDVLARLWPLASPVSLDDLGQGTLHLRVVPAPADLVQ